MTISSNPITTIADLFESKTAGALNWLVGLNRTTKFLLLLGIDGLLCLTSVWISFALRLGELRFSGDGMAIAASVALVLWLLIFTTQGIYQSILRFVGARTMLGIVTSCMTMMAFLVLLFGLNQVQGVPRTITIIQPMVFAALLMMSRLVARYVLFDLLNEKLFAGLRQNVLIYGAGSAGRQLAVSLRHEPGIFLQGYVDDDIRLKGKSLDGVRVYSSDDIGSLVQRLNVQQIVFAVPSVSRQRREEIFRKFEDIPVKVMTLPPVGDLLSGSVSISDLREVDISDLLGREPVAPNEKLLHRIVTARSVMITGAGGSIGSELCRQVSQLAPEKLILAEMTEHALYLIEAELREAQAAGKISPEMTIHPELGSIADRDTTLRLFERWKPDTVIHAAAYKHVPLVEENVIAGVRNNVFGTLQCALAADAVGVKNFILVSTDKAVRPTNVMGASKRACELILQALAARGSRTCFTMVRFGNVLGSSGSVVPRFKQQIKAGGPVTLTHREVTRYFMTIPEAAQLVIQAGAMADGGEVYVLDMGEPVKIYDLARTLINLSGLSVRDAEHPNGDIEIREVGLRKGEKLYEELLIGDSPRPTRHERIMQARESFLAWDDLTVHLDTMNNAIAQGDREHLLRALCTVVPEFQGEQSVKQATA